MKKLLKTSDEQALGGGNASTQWRRRQKDPNYAAIWFKTPGGELTCFEEDRNKYWQSRKTANGLAA